MTSEGDDLEERLVSFASSIVRFSSGLAHTPQGRHVYGQILRAGTAPAANYAEGRGAESRADFIHKLGMTLKELNETAVWLQIIGKSGLSSSDKLSGLVAENRELCRIINASIQTARKKQ